MASGLSARSDPRRFRRVLAGSGHEPAGDPSIIHRPIKQHCRTPVRESSHDQHGDLQGRRGPRRRAGRRRTDLSCWTPSTGNSPATTCWTPPAASNTSPGCSYAVQVAVAGEIDLAQLAQTHGQPSTAALLRHALNIGPGDARGRVRAARQVLPQDAISGGEIPPRLPALGHALRAGALGAEQTTIVVKTMNRIPTDIPVRDPRTRRNHPGRPRPAAWTRSTWAGSPRN